MKHLNEKEADVLIEKASISLVLKTLIISIYNNSIGLIKVIKDNKVSTQQRDEELAKSRNKNYIEGSRR